MSTKTKQPEVVERLIAHIKAEMKKTGADLFSEDPIAAPTGSRVICDPPVMDTDEDWLIYVPEEFGVMVGEFLEKEGATSSGEQQHYPDGWVFWLGTLNLIVVYDCTFFARWVHATYYARLAGLQSKQARKEFFTALVDCRSLNKDLIL